MNQHPLEELRLLLEMSEDGAARHPETYQEAGSFAANCGIENQLREVAALAHNHGISEVQPLLRLLRPCDNLAATIAESVGIVELLLVRLQEQETRPETPAAVEPPAVDLDSLNECEQTDDSKKKKDKKPTVNQRMWYELSLANSPGWGWTIDQWRQHLNVKSKSSIHATEAWRAIQAAKVNDLLKRNPTATDKRRNRRTI